MTILSDEDILQVDNEDYSTVLYYSKAHNYYTTKNAYQRIEILPASKEIAILYFKKQFKAIFPEYNEATDYVDTSHMGNDIYIALHRKAQETQIVVPGGLYRLHYYGTGYRVVLSPVEISKADDILPLKNANISLAEDIKIFFDSGEVYSKLKIKHKRAALLYGPPGCGKTLSIGQLMRSPEMKDVVFIVIDPKMDDLMELIPFREALNQKRVVFVIEEITQRLKGDQEEYLNFLDGEYSWNGCYTIATTNYPDELEDNIVKRPGRFDSLIYFDLPDIEDRRIYLENYLDTVSDDLLAYTERFTVSYLKELILRTLLWKRPPEEVAVELKQVRKLVESNFKGNGKDKIFGL